jgi:hypothetical protein
MLDTVVAMPDVVVAIVTAKKLTEKGLPLNPLARIPGDPLPKTPTYKLSLSPER